LITSVVGPRGAWTEASSRLGAISVNLF
jgi:hypothetical protein